MTSDHVVDGFRLEDRGVAPRYMTGFGNHFSTESEKGALPRSQNSPQKPPMGLYAEQISGTAFTAPRALNRRSWLYRILPSVKHGVGFKPISLPNLITAPNPSPSTLAAQQLRLNPLGLPDTATDFVDGLVTITTCGDAGVQAGMASHIYCATKPMANRAFQNADGEILLLPELGGISVTTEMGLITATPGEMVLIPRGVKFKVDPIGGQARGYVLENYGAMLDLPERGPIGANSLADERHFLTPVSAYEDSEEPYSLVLKQLGRIFEATIPQSPFDVVAWHGNYAPCKYDLRLFQPVGAILTDHPDPSIFTVLTSPSDTAGVANVDFVIFPERWLVAENTFRPPWYHTNFMSEFMGLLYGVYDAKPGGFVPGGMSLHNAILPHGPDKEAFDGATAHDLSPQKLPDTMAFMFETRFIQQPTSFIEKPGLIDTAYIECWVGLERHFKRP